MKFIKSTIQLIILTALIVLGLGNVVYAQTASMLNFAGKVTNTDGTELLDGNYDFSFSLYDSATGGAAVWTENLTASTCLYAVITGVTPAAQGIVYDFDTASANATGTLRVGQYLNTAGGTDGALITDFDALAGTVTVASGSPEFAIGATINNRPFVEGGVIDINLGAVNDFSGVDFSGDLYLQIIFNSETMQPRKVITAAARAFETEQLGGKTESQFGTLTENETISGEWNFENILSAVATSAETALTITQNGSGNIVEFKHGTTTYFAVLPDGRIQFENYTFPAANGTPGYVLKATAGGQLVWGVDFAGSGGGSGLIASGSDLTYGDFIYESDAGMAWVLGNNVLTGPAATEFEVEGLSWFDTVGLSQAQELRFYDADSSNYIALKSTSTQTGNYVLTLPSGTGTNGQTLVTDGTGNLRWDSPSGFTYVEAGTAGQIPYYRSNGSLLSATSSLFITPSGRFGLGTATPSQLLSVGASAGNQFLVNGSGVVLDGTWNGDPISVIYGGTGTTTFEANSVLYAPSADTIGEVLAGTNGYVLKMTGGIPTWGPDLTVGGEASLWASTTNNLIVHPTTVSNIVVIGASGTSTLSNIILEVAGNSLFGGSVSAQSLSLANALAVDMGGTGTTTFTVNSLVYASAANTIGQILPGSEGRVLKIVGGIPTWSATSTGGAHSILSTDHSDVTPGAVARGDLIIGQGVTPTWTRMALGPTGYILRSDGTDAVWSTTTNITALGTITAGTWQAGIVSETYGGTGQGTWNQGDIVFATSSNNLAALPIGTAGYIIQAVGGRPAWVSTSSLGIDFSAVGGTLAVDQGGTGQDFSASTGFLYFDNGVAYASNTVSIERSNLVGGSGINLSGHTLTLDRTGDWTGTFDTYNASDFLLLTSWYATTTDALDEGSINRYYHTSLFAADLSGTTTNALAEGSLNKYYHTYLFAADLSGTTTDALSQGASNLYWSDSRFNTQFDLRLTATTSLPNITDLSSLDTVGTITSGVWEGTTIDVAHGGTGLTGIAEQSLLFASSDNVIDEFAIGNEGEVLVIQSGNLAWASTSPAAAHSLLSVAHADATATSTLIRGDILVADASNKWSRLGLGTSGYILYSNGTDTIWSTTTAITALGIVAQGTWRANIVEIAYGGTGASTATGARENLDLDEAYKFGINATGTNGEIWMSDGDGRGYWTPTSTLGISAGGGNEIALFIGTTTVTTDGSIATGSLTGYAAANDICKAQYPESFFCRTYDIIASINESNISGWGNDTSSAWIAEGPPGYTSDSNDCSGWKSASTLFLGAYWKFNLSGGGAGWLINCGNNLPVACCTWQ